VLGDFGRGVWVAEQIMVPFLLFVLEGDNNQARLHWFWSRGVNLIYKWVNCVRL